MEAHRIGVENGKGGHWWVQWAALGIGFAWVISLLRVIRALVLVGGIAALIAYLRRR
jgi:hypothetical protein